MEYAFAAIGSFALVLLIGLFWFMSILLKHYGELNEQSIEREERLLGIISGLQNNLSAKDLSGYMALQAADRKPAEHAKPAMGRSDDEEAYLEDKRMLMAATENGGADYP